MGKEFKIGGVYRVDSDGAEKGNIIRILGVCGTPGGGTGYLYETLQGKGPKQSGFYFSSAFARGLELVESERKIVITTDGKTTIAKLYDGRKTIREAKSVCSDADTFDFNIGAFLAVERLTGCLLENIRLTTGRPKPKTLRDVVAEREPDKIDPDELGGVKHCPHHYDYLRDVKRKPCNECSTCDECWSQPYTPKEEAKPEPPKPKTLRDVVAEQIIDGVVKAAAESLRNQLRKRITNEKTGGNNNE